MPIDRAEKNSRDFVDAIRERIDAMPVDDVDIIRASALAMFTKELEGKIRNLQDDETLQVTFRIDIVGTDGNIRGGSGVNRNMPEYIEWRRCVYERDGYTCQECGSKGHLEAHHIKAWSLYPALRFDVANGVTLCRACHQDKHPHLRMIHGTPDQA